MKMRIINSGFSVNEKSYSKVYATDKKYPDYRKRTDLAKVRFRSRKNEAIKESN